MFLYAGNGEPGSGQDGNGLTVLGANVFFPESISGNGYDTNYILQSFGSLRVVKPPSVLNGTDPNDDVSPKKCKCECDSADPECEKCEEDDPKCDECNEEEQDCKRKSVKKE